MTTAVIIILAIAVIAIVILTLFIIKSDDVKTSMILRFAIVYTIMLAVASMVVVQIFKIQYVEHDKLVALQKTGTSVPDTIIARRGNILSDDGSLMASSMPTYYLYMDMRVEALKQPDKKSGKLYFDEKVDSLAMALADKFKDKSAEEYKRDLNAAFQRGASEYLLYPGRVNYADYKEVQKFPILCRGPIQGGFSTKLRTVRINPFGMLASRTIGNIYGIYEKGGRSGLELYYNDILCGKNGLQVKEKKAGKMTDIILQPAQDGCDIVSTINIKYQEIVETELMNELLQDGAKCGCAVVMEVGTGKIKAIANLTRQSDGTYAESTNIACGSEIDPGSTFKTVSALVAIEDGALDTTTMVSTGTTGVHAFADRQMKDWCARNGYGFGDISLAKAIHQSSNIGVSVLIDKCYGSNPQYFVDLIHKTRLDSTIELEIPGHARVKIKDRTDPTWSLTTLPWMSIGYEVVVPPIYTLMFYNGIANNGKMMKPMFVSEIRESGGKVRRLEPTVLNEQICSMQTISKVNEMLKGVITRGTGKDIKSKMFTIAGKTGTSQIFYKGSNKNEEGRIRHQITFCGYFPADNPMYTMIVYIKEPVGGASAGKMCGKVFRNVAEKLYVLNNGEIPQWAQEEMGASTISKDEAMEQEKEIPTTDYKELPDLSNKTAAEALYILESMGIKVNIIGSGRVTDQSVQAGTPISNIHSVTLTLN